MLKSKKINLSPNLKTNCLIYNYNNSLHPYSALILLCDIGETVWFSILDRIGFLLWVLTQSHLLERLKLKAKIWMQIGRDLAFWQFSFFFLSFFLCFWLIVTLPLFESLQGQDISISHVCETKPSNIGREGYKLACFIFSQVLDFQPGIFVASQRML